MKYISMSCEEFISELASKKAIPGGGGASALVGAIGIALGMMVGNLTVGKSSYASVEREMQKLLERSEAIRSKLMDLVDEDAKAFEPLSKAYGIPKDDPSRYQVMEDALKQACTVPMEIMRLCARAIEFCDDFAQKGSRLALSDAGVCAVLCKAALQGASLNVFINTKYMDNKAHAKAIETEAVTILEKYCQIADEIYNSVKGRLK